MAMRNVNTSCSIIFVVDVLKQRRSDALELGNCLLHTSKNLRSVPKTRRRECLLRLEEYLHALCCVEHSRSTKSRLNPPVRVGFNTPLHLFFIGSKNGVHLESSTKQRHSEKTKNCHQRTMLLRRD